MRHIRSICVYCGSRLGKREVFRKAAIHLGQTLAKNDLQLVFGGGQAGLMGVISAACLEAGGKVTGILTQFLSEYEGSQQGLNELHVVDSMHERKALMFEKADAFIIFPGGLGTLDEAFEMLTWKQVGLHSKPILFLNIEEYWTPLLQGVLENVVTEGFARSEDRDLFTVVRSVEEVIPILHAPSSAPSGQKNFRTKWEQESSPSPSPQDLLSQKPGF